MRTDQMRLDKEEESKHNWEKIEKQKKEERRFRAECLRKEEQNRLSQVEQKSGHYVHPDWKTTINKESKPKEERQSRLKQGSPSDRSSSDKSDESWIGERSDCRRRKRNDDCESREDREKHFQRQGGFRGNKKFGDNDYRKKGLGIDGLMRALVGKQSVAGS